MRLQSVLQLEALTSAQIAALPTGTGRYPAGALVFDTTLNMMRANIGTDAAQSWITERPIYATAPPATPADGQEWVWVDSVTNPTFQWRMRFNAGSASTFKWEFIGGAPQLVAGVASTTLPARAGDYLITAKGYHDESGGTTTGGDETATLVVGATNIDSQVQNGPSTAASGTGQRGFPSFALAGKITGAAASATVTLGNISTANAKIMIQPIRVS